MVERLKKHSELLETRARKISEYLHSLVKIILEISIMVFLISALAQLFSLQFHALTVNLGERDLKPIVTFALVGAGGVLALSFVILAFVYLLRARTKKLNELEARVISAFMKALDQSPLKSKDVDTIHGTQLHSQ